MLPIDTTNLFLVAAHGDGIIIMNPPIGKLTNEQSLNLAAWLVAMGDPTGTRFTDVLTAVQNT